jgi:tetratricopeptide (TPR) repeat protein
MAAVDPSVSANHVAQLMERVKDYLNQLEISYDAQMVDDATDIAREAVAVSMDNVDDARIHARILLSHLLRHRCEHYLDEEVLQEAIDIQRETRALCYKDHPLRDQSCEHLALSLLTRYERGGDVRFLDEAIDLEREALDLRPDMSPFRLMTFGNLAVMLKTRYKCNGDVSFWNEAIDLERTAHHLRPEGDPDRAISCGNLATSLGECYERTGNVDFLYEAIDLEREALKLRPIGHPDRSLSCTNLAFLFTKLYHGTGDITLIDNTIDLEREALSLHPPGHPLRAVSYANLAISLRTRYERTGDDRLIDEAIDLERQALELRPKGHPDRSISCANLAISLRMRYQRFGDDRLLNEAVGFEQEALALRPAGHPLRALSCTNLATSLRTRYESTGVASDSLIDEIIALDREALDLRPKGHPEHIVSCGNLAISLRTCYVHTRDETVLHEIYILADEAYTNTAAHQRWMYLNLLAWVHLQTPSSYYDVSKAIFYLSQSLEDEHDYVLLVVQEIMDLLEIVWNCEELGKHIELTGCYRRLVSLMPLLAHPALAIQRQLRLMKDFNRIGSDAFVNAALAEDSTLGLECLELAQGVIWSQSLHRRNPELEDVPVSLANNLQQLLQAMVAGAAVDSGGRNVQDALHASSSRMYVLLREIRALPGLDRFMLGEAFDTLRSVAANHPVVVLVGAHRHYYAFIIASTLMHGHALLEFDINDEDLSDLSFYSGATKLRRGSDSAGGRLPLDLERLSMKKNTPSRPERLNRYFKNLWLKLVKPVLDYIGLKVNIK